MKGSLSAMILVIFSLIILGFSSCTNSINKRFSVMTWNIWHGGIHGTKADGFTEDTINTANILKVLNAEDPDILLMQETYCCGMEIASQAGYKYSWRSSSNLSIHSKYPIRDTIEIYKPFNAQGAIINVNGDHFLVFNIWLNYLPNTFDGIKTMSEDSLSIVENHTRVKEIKSILTEIDSIHNIYNLPMIIGGDFNSASHLDWIEQTKDSHYGKVVNWPVSNTMAQSGFTDSFREANPDPTSSLEGTWGYLNDDLISDRIDYVYYKSKLLKTIDSKIVMDDPPDGFFNSDHRAIFSLFEFNQ